MKTTGERQEGQLIVDVRKMMQLVVTTQQTNPLVKCAQLGFLYHKWKTESYKGLALLCHPVERPLVEVSL